MTLQDIFDNMEQNLVPVLLFLVAVPVLTALFAWVGKGEAHKSPWKYVYSVLVYLAAVPGILAITLSIYTFLFERKSLLDVNVLVYFLPVVTMFVTFVILKRIMDLDDIPGIGRLSGLMLSIFIIISLMYLLDRINIHIITFVRLPIQYLILIFLGMLLLLRYGIGRMMKN